MKNYYKHLGIDPSASHEDVKHSYKKLMTYFKSKDSLTNDEKIIIKKIKNAYSILKDYHKRREYDNQRDGIINRNISNNIALRTFEPVKQNFLKPFFDINFNDNHESMLKNVDLSKNNNYYIESFQSTAKSNNSGGFDIEEKNYINENGKESRKSRKYKTDKQNLFIE